MDFNFYCLVSYCLLSYLVYLVIVYLVIAANNKNNEYNYKSL